MSIMKLHSTCIVYNGKHEYCTQFHPLKLSVTPSMAQAKQQCVNIAPELAQLCNDYYTVWHMTLAMYIEF